MRRRNKMHKKVYGYVRISSNQQNINRQLDCLKEFEIPTNQIFIDKITGANFNRKEYKKMIRKIKAGDLLIIKSIDRLGRDYAEILEQWRYLTKVKNINIKVIDMPLIDINEENSLIHEFIADLVLQILSFVAETELDFIHQRQKEGIKSAKKRGVKFGRPNIEKPVDFNNIKKNYIEKRLSSRKCAELLGVAQGTFLKWVKEECECNS